MSSPKPEDTVGGPPPLDTNMADEAGAPPIDSDAPEAGATDADAYVDAGTREEVLEIRLTEMQAELDQAKDKHLRALAEGENIRRRAQKDRDEMQKYGGVKLARDLLPVHDNLQRALKSLTDEQRAAAADFVAGIELTERELINAFGKHQIVPIAPELGEKFNPDMHQAMFEAPIPGAVNGTIIEVIQTGFVCHDRLVRAAMVGVAKGSPVVPVPDEEGESDADGAT